MVSQHHPNLSYKSADAQRTAPRGSTPGNAAASSELEVKPPGSLCTRLAPCALSARPVHPHEVTCHWFSYTLFLQGQLSLT